MSENESARDAQAIEALRAWDEAQPGYDVEAGAARLRASLGLPPTPPPASAPPGLGMGTIAAAAAAVATVIAGGWLYSARPVASSPATAWSIADVPVEPPADPSPQPEPSMIAAAPPVERIATPQPQRPSAPTTSATAEQPRPRRSKRAKDPTPPAEFPSELALLRDMRAALSRAPKRALELGERLDELYPRGVLLEERAALRVLALEGAGKTKQAHAAAVSFLRAHPGSAFAARIGALSSKEVAESREGSEAKPQESR